MSVSHAASETHAADVTPANDVRQSLAAGAIALAAGLAATVAPPLGLLAIGILAVRALMTAQGPFRLDLAGFVGPLAAAALVGAMVSPAGAVGVLFVWRMAADARWSLSHARGLARSAGAPAQARTTSLLPAMLTPAFGLAYVAYTSPHLVAGFALDLPHLPALAAYGVGAAAALLTADWMLRRAADWRLGALAPAPAAHLMCHHLIFAGAFGGLLDVSAGIVMVAAWRLAHAGPALAFARGARG